jgi:hypothetical protein
MPEPWRFDRSIQRWTATIEGHGVRIHSETILSRKGYRLKRWVVFVNRRYSPPGRIFHRTLEDAQAAAVSFIHRMNLVYGPEWLSGGPMTGPGPQIEDFDVIIPRRRRGRFWSPGTREKGRERAIERSFTEPVPSSSP